MIPTGADASVYYNNNIIGTAKNVQLDVDSDNLPTTVQGDTHKTYRQGLKDTTITLSLFYDASDSSVTYMLSKIYENDNTYYPLVLIFDIDADTYIAVNTLVKKLGMSVSFGAAQVADLTLQVSGPPSTIKIIPVDPGAYNYEEPTPPAPDP